MKRSMLKNRYKSILICITVLLMTICNVTNSCAYTYDDLYPGDYDLKAGGFDVYKNHVYQLITLKMTWEEAEKYCESKGGHLITISDLYENDFVNELIYKNIFETNFWIGINPDDNGKWVTGERVQYNDPLEYGEPSMAAKYIVASKNGWTNVTARELYFVCEWDIEYEKIDVMINNAVLSFPDQQPIMCNNRILMPVRSIFEALGASISWDEQSQTVIAQKDDISIEIKIGTVSFAKNGNYYLTDMPAIIYNERTMLPLRAVSEALGCDVNWDENTQTVIITSTYKPHQNDVIY